MTNMAWLLLFAVAQVRHGVGVEIVLDIVYLLMSGPLSQIMDGDSGWHCLQAYT